MKTPHPDLVALVKGLIYNFDDQAQWNAVEDYCREQEMEFQVACFDYMKRLDHALINYKHPEPRKHPTGKKIKTSRLFTLLGEKHPFIYARSTASEIGPWNTPWFPKQYDVNTPFGRGLFPRNATSIGRLFACYMMKLFDMPAWWRIKQTVATLAAMKLVDHKTRNDHLSWDHKIYETDTDYISKKAATGHFGDIQHVVYWYMWRWQKTDCWDNPKTIDGLWKAESLVDATRQWVEDMIKDQPQSST